MLGDALAVGAESMGVRAAQEYGRDFGDWPTDARERDAALLAGFNGDFEKLCQSHYDKRKERRLSVRRIKSLIKETHPEYRRLVKIARGIRIQRPPRFAPNGKCPLQRAKYVLVSGAANKLILKQWNAGTVLLLPTKTLLKVDGIHFSPQHWAVKAGKACGRIICDVANSDPGEIPVNGDGKDGKEEMREKMREEWGEIVHPTLEDIAEMLNRARAKWDKDELVMWKMDLSGAFNLMSFAPDASRILAFELTGDMSVVHVTGMFGWVGSPYAFQVITRTLAGLLGARLVGFTLWYVDDCIGVVPRWALQQDIAEAVRIVEALLGPESVAYDKFDYGRRIVGLGWTFDLDIGAVTIAERNMKKVLHCFFCVDAEQPVSLEELEKMASLASRYAVLCKQMKPFTHALHSLVAGYAGSHVVRRELSENARSDVVMWRAFLCLLQFREDTYARTFESFAPRGATVVIEYDASLVGFGVGVSEWCAQSRRFELRRYCRLDMPYEVDEHDSSFQNANEYMAVMLGLLMIRETGCIAPDFAFKIVGDNTTSLSWSAKERVKSQRARRANIASAMIAIDLNASIAETEHIAGEDNVVYDGLSRGKDGPEVGLPADLQLRLVPESLTLQYIIACDPNQVLTTVDDHTAFTSYLLKLLKDHPNPCLRPARTEC